MKWVGEILVWEGDTPTIFRAKIQNADENHPHHTPRYWDGYCYYLAHKCRLATDEEISYFEDMEEEYGNVTAISISKYEQGKEKRENIQ